MTTYVSATFADAAHQVATVQTEEVGTIMLSQRDTPDEWDLLLATIEPEPYAPPTPTLDNYKAAFDAHLDEVAQSKLYDNRVTIATYSGTSNPQWAAEASAFIAWRDAAMLSMFAQLEAFQNGGPQPSITDFIAGLPVMEWPA